MATKIRCKYIDCAFLDEGYCSAAQIDLDSDKGCLTYQSCDELSAEDIIEDPEDIKEWDDAEEEEENEDDDPWMDDEEEDEEQDDYN